MRGTLGPFGLRRARPHPPRVVPSISNDARASVSSSFSSISTEFVHVLCFADVVIVDRTLRTRIVIAPSLRRTRSATRCVAFPAVSSPPASSADRHRHIIALWVAVFVTVL
jgi:hypothetical protein